MLPPNFARALAKGTVMSCSSYYFWLPLFDFGIFCHLLRLMGIYRVGPTSGYLKTFVISFVFFSSFSFFFNFCFSFLFFIFIFGLSHSLGGPFSSGAPGHYPPMPPCRYATGSSSLKRNNKTKQKTNKQTNKNKNTKQNKTKQNKQTNKNKKTPPSSRVG